MFNAASRFKLLRGATALAVGAAMTALVAPAAQARPTWDTSPVNVVHDLHAQQKVVDLRVGGHRHFDRVVIDLDGKVPGYRVRYVKRLFSDPSGEPVPLKGRKFIAVSLVPAKAHDRRGDSVYDGPRLAQYDFTTLRGVAFTGDTEGVVSFGISLRHKADFRVSVLHAPNRILIDLRR